MIYRRLWNRLQGDNPRHEPPDACWDALWSAPSANPIVTSFLDVACTSLAVSFPVMSSLKLCRRILPAGRQHSRCLSKYQWAANTASLLGLASDVSEFEIVLALIHASAED